VVNSYPSAECDYKIQQSNFYFSFPSNDGDRITLIQTMASKQKHSHTDNWMMVTKYSYLINVNKIVTKNK